MVVIVLLAMLAVVVVVAAVAVAVESVGMVAVVEVVVVIVVVVVVVVVTRRSEILELTSRLRVYGSGTGCRVLDRSSKSSRIENCGNRLKNHTPHLTPRKERKS